MGTAGGGNRRWAWCFRGIVAARCDDQMADCGGSYPLLPGRRARVGSGVRARRAFPPGGAAVAGAPAGGRGPGAGDGHLDQHAGAVRLAGVHAGAQPRRPIPVRAGPADVPRAAPVNGLSSPRGCLPVRRRAGPAVRWLAMRLGERPVGLHPHRQDHLPAGRRVHRPVHGVGAAPHAAFHAGRSEYAARTADGKGSVPRRQFRDGLDRHRSVLHRLRGTSRPGLCPHRQTGGYKGRRRGHDSLPDGRRRVEGGPPLAHHQLAIASCCRW